jgi:hypothetical protein
MEAESFVLLGKSWQLLALQLVGPPAVDEIAQGRRPGDIAQFRDRDLRSCRSSIRLVYRTDSIISLDESH